MRRCPLLSATECQDNRLMKFLTRDYRVTSQVGQGGYGNIYRATDTRSHRSVAIKVVPSSKSREQIENEADVMRQLDHKNCASFIDYKETDAHIALVMNYGDRGDLFEYLFPSDFKLGQKPVTEKQALRIFVLIILGLEHMHKKNIIHRDLKPENIFLDSEMNVVIGDFGLSVRFDPIGGRRVMNTGTLHYTPPEAIRNIAIRGPEVDIWSAGVVLYEMLFGCYPFFGKTSAEVLKQVDCSPAELYDGISSATADLLNILLAKDPTRRATIPQIRQHPAVAAMFANPRRLNLNTDQMPLEGLQVLQASLKLDSLPRQGTSSQESSPRTPNAPNTPRTPRTPRSGEYTPGRTPRRRISTSELVGVSPRLLVA